MPTPPRRAPGPFRADQLKPGDPYELSDGHPVYCAPAGGRHGGANHVGALPLATDPAVLQVGVDVGFSPAANVLRAPDIAVGNVPDVPGWVEGVPPLAVEYADTGTDETDLAQKIAELLAAGTQQIWVVRLTGARRVDVHERGRPMRTEYPGGELRAPGVLKNPVRVEALYDRDAALDAALRNMLQRKGYESLEAVRAQGVAQGVLEGLKRTVRMVYEARHGAMPAVVAERLAQARDAAVVEAWARVAATESAERFADDVGASGT